MVFPTPVGVFLRNNRKNWANNRLPHARGGVSVPVNDARELWESSPRPWGCFLFQDYH